MNHWWHYTTWWADEAPSESCHCGGIKLSVTDAHLEDVIGDSFLCLSEKSPLSCCLTPHLNFHTLTLHSPPQSVTMPATAMDIPERNGSAPLNRYGLSSDLLCALSAVESHSRRRLRRARLGATESISDMRTGPFRTHTMPSTKAPSQPARP